MIKSCTPWLLVLAVCATPALADDAVTATATIETAPAPVDPAPAVVASAASDAPAKEEVCNDKLDNDGDSVLDCGDSDCKDESYCKPDGKPEGGNDRCSDWIDNDGDGQIDCEDQECKLASVTVCNGSWQGDLEGTGGDGTSHTSGGGEREPSDAGSSGSSGNKRLYSGDVEQPDSSEGVGFVGIRFGIVAAVQQLVTSTNAAVEDTYATRIDTRFDTLQLRAFGNLPLLEDSFFLLSIAAAQSPRLTFALFQFPLGNGHYMNINTGGGTLSSQPLVSVAKLPLLDRPTYFLRPFDQFLDAGVEVNGPIILNLLRYRVMAGGGTGLEGNFGGRFFEDATINPTFTAGGQLWFTPVGIYNRFDSPFLYRPVPQAAAFALGAKYEQREAERFPAAHATAVYRQGVFAAQVESYSKAELNYGALQMANYLQVGVLLYPEWFFLAADVGHFMSSDPGMLTTVTGIKTDGDASTLPNALRRQVNNFQARAALHWYFWRQNGVMSARYSFTQSDPVPLGAQATRTFPVVTNEVVLQAQVRF
jgi:hypothetical protein